MKKFLLSLQYAVLSFFCISATYAQNWNQILKVNASDREDKITSGRSAGDAFGLDVAIFGDLAIIGASGESQDENGQNPLIGAGAAYIFQKISGEWKIIRKLYPDVRQSGQHFGTAVSINYQYAVVGAQNNSSAYIFKRDGGGSDNWAFLKKLTPTNAAEGSGFGNAVSLDSLSGLAVGASADEGMGSVYIFSKDIDGPENWGLVKKLTAPSPQANGKFGSALCLWAGSLMIGSSGDNSDGSLQNHLPDAGAAYLFGRSQDGLDNWEFVRKLVAPTRVGGAAFGSSVSIYGSSVVVGAPLDDPMPGTSKAYGAAYIFSNWNFPTNWTVIKKLVAPVREYDDNFGNSVSISGNYVVVGSSHEDQDQSETDTLEGSGSAYIFGKNQNGSDNWGLIRKVTAQYRAANDFFGSRVAISGESIMFGAVGEAEDQFEKKTLSSAGAAYFHNYSVGGNNSWGLTQKVVASTGSLTKRLYGNAVSISGNYAIVGTNDQRAGLTSGYKGPVYILYNNAGTWTEVKRIDPPEEMVNDNFGSSVAINGNYAVVGATDSKNKFVGGQWMEATSGVHLFEKDKGGPGNWGLVKQLEPKRYKYDRYGFSLALQGDYVVVGAPFYPANNTAPNDLTGAAFLFQKDFGGSNNWGLAKTITLLFLGNGDGFGSSVAINGDNLLVGANGEGHDASENNFMRGSGAAYLFEKDFGGTSNWGQKQKLTAPTRHVSENFGSSVAISGDNLVVGAPQDSYDGDDGNYIDAAGSAYMFKKNSGSGLWVNVKKMTASSRIEFLHFGAAVAISGDNAVVGGGLLYDTAGSAWIYSKDKEGPEKWGLTQEITAQYQYPEDYFGYSVAISGKYILVGAPSDDRDFKEENWLTRAGAAYIFRNNEGSLPVTLSFFQATKSEKTTALKWITSQESNSNYFEVQRSRDGFTWEVLNKITASHESSEMKSYFFADKNPLEGENLYRLKMVDIDLSFSYSRIRSLFFETENTIQIYPNPTTDRIFLAVPFDLSKIESVTIKNSLGQIILKSQGIGKDGISLRNFTPGIYIVEIKKVNETSKYQKVIVY